MRRRTVIAWIAVAWGLLFGFLGEAADSQALFMLAGLGFLVAIGIGLAALPWWHKLGLDMPYMPGLFQRPGPGERWSPSSGRPEPETAPGEAQRRRPPAARRKRSK